MSGVWWRWGGIGALVGLLCGCQTAGAGERVEISGAKGQGAGGGMMGLEERPAADFWAAWPAQALPLVLPAGVEATAFDAWRVEDAAFVASAWGAIFVALDFVRTQPDAPAEVQATLKMLQATLEPDAEQPSELDITFLASRAGDWEAMVVRLWHRLPSGGVPGVAIMLRREAGQALPSQVWLWAVSGHAPGAPLSARVEQRGALVIKQGIDALAAGEGQPASGAEVVLQVLRAALWEPCVGEGYAEPAVRRRKRADGPAAPPVMPPALGLKVRDRDVEQVMPDTAFVPTIDDEDLPF